MRAPDEATPLACPIPTHAEDQPPSQPVVMLAFRFLLEMIAFGGIAYGGWRLGDGGVTGVALAAIGVIAATAAWGALTVPDDPSRNPTPVIVVPGWLRLLVELTIFGLAAWSLWIFVSRAASETFLTGVGIMLLVGWDRVWWMLRYR
jgi:hypothetical protein